MLSSASNDKKINPIVVRWQDKNKNNISAQEQAAVIIQKFKEEIDAGRKVAITYSANNDQAKEIYEGYKTGKYNIEGANQAQVIALVIKAIHDNGWEDKAHILPVATSLHAGGVGEVSTEIVERDLANIAQHVGAGWHVLGYQNQANENTKNYAIGGGISQNVWQGQNKTRFDSAMRDMTDGKFEGKLKQAFDKGSVDTIEGSKAKKGVTQQQVPQQQTHPLPTWFDGVQKAFKQYGIEISYYPQNGEKSAFVSIKGKDKQEMEMIQSAMSACNTSGSKLFFEVSPDASFNLGTRGREEFFKNLAAKIGSAYDEAKKGGQREEGPLLPHQVSNQTEDLFSATPPLLTPQLAHQHQSTPPLHQEPLAETPQTSLKEIQAHLEKNKDSLGVQSVNVLSDKSLAVELKEQDQDKKPLNYFVNETPSGGAAFSMKAGLSEEDAQKVIENACKVAIETAKPGAEIKISDKAPNKEAIEQALQRHIEQAIKDKKFTADDAPKIKSSHPSMGMRNS